MELFYLFLLILNNLLHFVYAVERRTSVHRSYLDVIIAATIRVTRCYHSKDSAISQRQLPTSSSYRDSMDT